MRKDMEQSKMGFGVSGTCRERNHRSKIRQLLRPRVTRLHVTRRLLVGDFVDLVTCGSEVRGEQLIGSQSRKL